MKPQMRSALVGAAGFLLVMVTWQGAVAQQQEQQPISKYDRERALTMLSDVRYALKKNYYDPSFHGVDVDARYKTYEQRINATRTLADAFRTVAAYLSGLDDSHTFFVPPRRSYRINYDYRMQIIGETPYITDVRPNTDAAQKLHPGDQILTLDGYSLNRKDLWQLEYYLDQIAPEITTRFKLRDVSGNVREEVVSTKYQRRQRLNDVSLLGSDFWRLVFEGEAERRLLRNRHVEQGDLMIWKMPVFKSESPEIEHLISMARKHKALILDLRGNPGGYEATLTELLGSVFDHDVKIGTRITRKGETKFVAKSHGKNTFTGKLIVIVDSRSGSAAELFARVVQIEGRGTVLGDRSSGTVMEASFFPFQSGVDVVIYYGASITEANLIMGDNTSLEKAGVMPDEVVLPKPGDLAAGRDPVLARAAELAGSALDPVAAGKLFPFEWAPE